MLKQDTSRLNRTRTFYGVASLLFILLVIYLMLALNTLLVPVLIGFLAAYLCLPFLKVMKGKGLSATASVLILFAGFLAAVVLLFQLVSIAIPDREETIDLKASLLINLQAKYQSVMGLQDAPEGNFLHKITGSEMEPLVHDLSCTLRLTPEEEDEWLWRRQEDLAATHLIQQYSNAVSSLSCDAASQEQFALDLNSGHLIPVPASGPPVVATIFNFLSVWFIMPFVFIYVLLDNGKTRKKLIHLVPNAYFEVTLTTLHSVDEAIGTYLRCLVSNMLIVGSLFAIALRMIGFEMAPALFIGLLNGLLNAVPVIGSLIGLGLILLYAIVTEHPATLLPFIDRDNIVLWAFIVFVLIQSADNALLKPFLMGKAIDLNPLVIIFAAVGGAVIGGFIGILLAIPAVLIVKAGFSTLRSELRRYFFIY